MNAAKALRGSARKAVRKGGLILSSAFVLSFAVNLLRLHQILTGTLAVSVTDQNGEKVEYRPTNRAVLERYVADLEAELAGAIKPPRRILFQTP
ncbi:hypothetical protein KBY28_08000 [Ruegeria pomeroyi]|uniref:gpW family protein n=1 Tax=Ruegeria pomeroyi TaxID=89184 RepID=UPI001F25BFF2|nr:gpW family protein [Ruegeria pomeroyi]MCE8508391.1 hypothetical protein [Ruegeria pomeroyi]